MKIITLNVWAGQILEPLLEFVKKEKDETDIFCFQEVFDEIKGNSIPLAKRYLPRANRKVYSQIQKILSEHNGYFAPAQDEFGLATFVRKNVEVLEEGDIFVFRERDSWFPGSADTLGRNMQYIKFQIQGKDITIANLHGIWTGKGKNDTPERLRQSKKIKEFLDIQKGAKILCGDFNLLPNTESVKILEEKLRNLVKEYKVKSTRTKLYDRYKNGSRFADYIMVSEGVKVLDFRVLRDVVSDHSPLYLEFNI